MCATNIPGNERSLVIRLIAGDEDAFCELYAAYKNRLIYFAMRFLKSREYAEDIFQDAFTTIWESRRFINPNTSFFFLFIYNHAQSDSKPFARTGKRRPTERANPFTSYRLQ